MAVSEAREGAGAQSVNPSTDTPIVPANYGRQEITVCNDSDTKIYLTFGEPAASGVGVPVQPNGTYTTQKFLGEIRAFHSGAAAKLVTYVEF